MAKRRIDEIVRKGAHPLETHFDIEPNSTEMVTTVRRTELEPYELYDAKDTEIEQDYQTIVDTTMDMVDRLTLMMDDLGTEPKYMARLMEVTGQQLNIALSAIEKRSKLKKDKDALAGKNPAGSATLTQTIVMDRNEMLALLKKNRESSDGEIIDVDSIEIPEDENNNKIR